MKRAVCLGPVILSAAFLSACNAGSPAAAAVATGTVSTSGAASVSDSATPGPTTTPSDPVAQQLTQLENEGKLPRLDRSESIAGPDKDGNGVRDDMDAYLLRRFADPSQRAVVIQMAKAMQSAVLAGGGSAEVSRAASEKLSDATHCLFLRLHDAEGKNTAAAVGLEIESLTTNTKARLLSYIAYNKSRDGTVSALPEGDTCE